MTVFKVGVAMLFMASCTRRVKSCQESKTNPFIACMHVLVLRWCVPRTNAIIFGITVSESVIYMSNSVIIRQLARASND